MLEKFINDYADRAYQFAFKLCGNQEEAKELVQEAFVKVMKNWEHFDQSQPLENWFFTVLRNLYVDGLKSHERKNRVSLDMPIGSEETLTLADALPDKSEEALLDRVERQEARSQVRRAVETLLPEFRAILTLADFQGMRYEEIAKVLGCAPGTVKSRISRARAALKLEMLRMMEDEVKTYAV